MVLNTSSYLDLLSTVTINTVVLILGLATALAVSFVLWTLFKKPLRWIGRSTGITPLDAKSDQALWAVSLLLLFVVVVGGYISAVIIFNRGSGDFHERSLVEACVKAVMVIAGAGVGLGICGGVLVVVTWLVRVSNGGDGDAKVGKTE